MRLGHTRNLRNGVNDEKKVRISVFTPESSLLSPFTAQLCDGHAQPARLFARATTTSLPRARGVIEGRAELAEHLDAPW